MTKRKIDAYQNLEALLINMAMQPPLPEDVFENGLTMQSRLTQSHLRMAAERALRDTSPKGLVFLRKIFKAWAEHTKAFVAAEKRRMKMSAERLALAADASRAHNRSNPEPVVAWAPVSSESEAGPSEPVNDPDLQKRRDDDERAFREANQPWAIRFARRNE